MITPPRIPLPSTAGRTAVAICIRQRLDGEKSARGGFRPRGVVGYLFLDFKPGTVPLYRFLRPGASSTFLHASSSCGIRQVVVAGRSEAGNDATQRFFPRDQDSGATAQSKAWHRDRALPASQRPATKTEHSRPRKGQLQERSASQRPATKTEHSRPHRGQLQRQSTPGLTEASYKDRALPTSQRPATREIGLTEASYKDRALPASQRPATKTEHSGLAEASYKDRALPASQRPATSDALSQSRIARPAQTGKVPNTR